MTKGMRADRLIHTSPVGGQIGMIGVLHIWARNLFYHPHVHYLIPGGGVGTNGQAALKYLAPYIHRVALSNRRLVSIHHRGSLEISQVTFQYRPTDTGRLKTCILSVEHFIQRFLQHILPCGFVKVRYFGFFGATIRSRLAALQQ